MFKTQICYQSSDLKINILLIKSLNEVTVAWNKLSKQDMYIFDPIFSFHGIFLNFAECGMGVKRGKSIFRGKKRNFSFFCGIPQKKFFFFTIFF